MVKFVGSNPSMQTGWTFFTLIFYKNCNVCLKRQKINEKEVGDGLFKKTTILNYNDYFRLVALLVFY